MVLPVYYFLSFSFYCFQNKSAKNTSQHHEDLVVDGRPYSFVGN